MSSDFRSRFQHRMKVVGRTGKISDFDGELGSSCCDEVKLGRRADSICRQTRRNKPIAGRENVTEQYASISNAKADPVDPYGYLREAEAELSARQEASQYQQGYSTCLNSGKRSGNNNDSGLHCPSQGSPETKEERHHSKSTKPSADALDAMLHDSEVVFQDFVSNESTIAASDARQDSKGHNGTEFGRKAGSYIKKPSRIKEEDLMVRRSNSDVSPIDGNGNAKIARLQCRIPTGRHRKSNSVHFKEVSYENNTDEYEKRLSSAPNSYQRHASQFPMSYQQAHPIGSPLYFPNAAGNFGYAANYYQQPSFASIQYPEMPHVVQMQQNIALRSEQHNRSQGVAIKLDKRKNRYNRSAHGGAKLPSLKEKKLRSHSVDSRTIRRRHRDIIISEHSEGAPMTHETHQNNAEDLLKPRYKPYTIDDYRLAQSSAKHMKLGGLGANTGTREWQKKMEKRQRMMKVAAKAREQNARGVKSKKSNLPIVKSRKLSAREKAKMYAANVPKPPSRSKSLGALRHTKANSSSRRKLGSARLRKQKITHGKPPLSPDKTSKEDEQPTMIQKEQTPGNRIPPESLTGEIASKPSSELVGDSLLDRQQKNLAQRDAVAEIRRQLEAM